MDKELQFLIYNTPEENVSVNAVIKDETIWLTQKAMAELFGVGVPAISKHLANIYAEGELNEISTVSKMEIVQQGGSRKRTAPAPSFACCGAYLFHVVFQLFPERGFDGHCDRSGQHEEYEHHDEGDEGDSRPYV